MCDLKPSVYTELLQLSDPNFGRWTLTFRMRDPKTSEIHMISASGSMHKFFSPCFLLGDATKISVNFFQKSKEKKKWLTMVPHLHVVLAVFTKWEPSIRYSLFLALPLLFYKLIVE